MKKETVRIVVCLDIEHDEEDVTTVLENMDYDFKASESTKAEIVETEIVDWEVIPS